MNNKYDEELISLFSQIVTQTTMADIFSNMLTPQEREELALRLQIFKGLMAGESQRALARKLEVSLATVSRGSRELKYGKPGIKKALASDQF